MAKRSPIVPEITPFQALLQRLQIQDVQLAGQTVSADVEFVRRHGEVDGHVEVALDFKSKPSVRAEQGSLECLLTLNWRAFEPGSARVLVAVEERYLVTYILAGGEPVADETLQAFADNNAAFNVWPFFRQSLHATTLRLGIPPFTLPLLKPRQQEPSAQAVRDG